MSRRPPKTLSGIAAADRLAERAQVGRDAEILLRPAGAHAEGAQHFVEDQQHAVLVASASRSVAMNSGVGRMQPAL